MRIRNTIRLSVVGYKSPDIGLSDMGYISTIGYPVLRKALSIYTYINTYIYIYMYCSKVSQIEMGSKALEKCLIICRFSFRLESDCTVFYETSLISDTNETVPLSPG